MEKKNNGESKLTKKFWIVMIVICVLLIVVVAVGYFLFSRRDVEVVDRTKSGGNVTLNYATDVNGLTIINAVPTAKDVAMKSLTEGQYFDFSVEVDLDNASEVEYEISVTKDIENSTINDNDIRIYLEKEESGTYAKVFDAGPFVGLKSKTDLGSKKGDMVLTKVKKKKTATDNYRLRMWLDSVSTMKTGNYSVEININGKAK